MTEWKDLMDDHITGLSSKPRNFSREVWVHGIIRLILMFLWKVWNNCNNDRHGRDVADKAKHRLDKAIRSTTSLYRFKPDVLPSHTHIFYTTIDEHLEKETTAYQLESWINTWRSLISRSVQKAKEFGLTRTRSILQYFST